MRLCVSTSVWFQEPPASCTPAQTCPLEGRGLAWSGYFDKGVDNRVSEATLASSCAMLFRRSFPSE